MKRFPLALLLLPLALTTIHAQDLLLENARIVDPASRTIVQGSLWIHEGKIRDLMTSAPGTFDGKVIDLTGKWIIPGLNDMHVHSFGNIAPGNRMEILGTENAAKAMLYAGVTGFLDLFSPEDQILPLRDRQRSSGLPGADIYAAGPILTATGGHGTEYGLPTRTINTPAEAERAVTELAAKRPDVVKIVYDHAFTMLPTIDRATMESAVKTATKHGLKTVIHIGTWLDAVVAIRAGESCITHAYGASLIPDELVALMKEKNVYECPTITVETDFLNMMQHRELLDRPLLAAVASHDVVDAYRGDTTKLDMRMKYFLGWQRASRANVLGSVKKMRDGGVRLLAGTDAGNPGTFQGYSLHRELELMVESGLTPWEALASTTTTAGEFLGRDFGMHPGAVANLLVLDASPIDDISNTQKIAMVIHHGRTIDREELLHPSARQWNASLIDDFSGRDLTSTIGQQWSIDNDSVFGGSSTIRTEERNGSLHVWGKLQPKSGMPGLAGISLQFDNGESPLDLTAFDGVRLKITSTKGPLSLKLLTTGVKNYDYHAAFIPNRPKPQTLELPFTEFRQIWSAPVAWTGRDVRGIALWVSSISSGDYDFTVDSIEFYKSRK
jgi:imidazolonepropionase-like amidohydrolase